ncbi:ABC transporter ATP-binding protein [Pseudooctadecabacter jejudonensis]|uniref:High-affinity branched-chain amino acid transport ATP-binding protein LivF n=1 Tax=Pseudooctadecabacter jejudonensis TaxID=1391910 RepID=A0A1Y5RJF8_9RHOB|nr:ABC transporter ATP-binding protein [Pseudooctadecabacter jejudonensis]SLN16180.1 High-affinity branched-chain amino acid transport ATP-binding protein LivF [Pseudooctadecabacter jejudonensis]
MAMDTVLSVAGLTKSFGGLQAVRGVDFEVERGAIVGLIGPNGAGKTTTFNMIAGELPPTTGKITLLGEDITGQRTDTLYHKGLMRTFQLSHEYARMTSLENLMVAAPDQTGESIWSSWFANGRVKQREAEVIELARDTLDFLGLTHVGEELAGNLSGGQKKLLEIGRTMMNDAKVVLLDEPGAGVNPTLMRKVGDMILQLNEERGYTFCIIEHDMDMIARLADKVVVLAEGQVLMEGTMDEVRSDERVIDAYFGGEVV